MPAMQKSKKGITLVEVIVAVIICAIVIVGASLFFVTGRSQVYLQGCYRQAVQLAGEKMEDVKAGNYGDLTAGVTEEDISWENVSYTRNIMIEDAGLYKKVNVSVYWLLTGEQRRVNLVTFIGPG